MIHVCHIISGDLYAGAEVMDYHLLKTLRRYDDLSLSAILLNEGRLAEEIRSIGVPLDVVDERKRGVMQMVGEIGRIMNRTLPDIVHSHRYKENILAFLASRHRKGTKLVTTQHGMPESFGSNRNAKYRLLHRLNFLLLSRSFRKVVAVSDDIRRMFIHEYGFSDKKVIMIHNGTEIPGHMPNATDGNPFRIGSMGRIFPVKDYSLMVEIAREVVRETDRVCFELAGDGPDGATIRELVDRYRLDKVFRVHGFIRNPGEFYQCLDLYLNTSFHEGIPLTVLEAMSHGIPVVAPDVGGLKEIVRDGVEGFLVEGRDPKRFARKCLLLRENGFLRMSMGESARNRVEKEFSNDRMARDYYHLYLDVVRDPAARIH